MSPTLRGYIMRMYLGAVALAAAAVLLVFLVIDFGDRLKAYVGHPALEVVELYLCKSAVTLGQLMPAAMLLAAGITLTVLKRRGELDAMRALGISPAAIVAPILLCAAPLGALLVVFDEQVAAPAGARVDRLMVERFGVWGDYRYFYGSQQWLRLGPDVFRVSNAQVTVFHLSSRFDLDRRIDAKAMTPLSSGAFELSDARIREYAQGAPHLRAAEREEVRFESADAKAFKIRPGRPEQMSTADLSEQQQVRAAAGQPTQRLALAQHGRFSYPFLGAVGAVLAAGLALRRGRKPQVAVALVEGLLICASMWGLLVIGKALALSERLPAPAAAWGPLVALVAAAAVLMLRLQKSS
jgi:lipopolysaccharide export system permease protein